MTNFMIFYFSAGLWFAGISVLITYVILKHKFESEDILGLLIIFLLWPLLIFFLCD